MHPFRQANNKFCKWDNRKHQNKITNKNLRIKMKHFKQKRTKWKNPEIGDQKWICALFILFFVPPKRQAEFTVLHINTGSSIRRGRYV